jgi:hypothetical protein
VLGRQKTAARSGAASGSLHETGVVPLGRLHLSSGPIEREASGLVLRIPLDAGGDELHLVCEQISHIDGDDLVVSIPDWLAKETNLAEDTLVIVDSRDGKLNITKAPVE